MIETKTFRLRKGRVIASTDKKGRVIIGGSVTPKLRLSIEIAAEDIEDLRLWLNRRAAQSQQVVSDD